MSFPLRVLAIVCPPYSHRLVVRLHVLSHSVSTAVSTWPASFEQPENSTCLSFAPVSEMRDNSRT